MTKYSNLPLVSICVAVFNRAKFLPQCLDSIINQTYSNIEIIIVYNKSTDNSLEIINNYALLDNRIKILFLSHENKAGQNGRQSYELAYNYASGEYLASVDSDDYIANNCVELCINNIGSNGLIYTYCQMFGDTNLLDNRARYSYSKKRLLDFFMVFHFRLFQRSKWLEIKSLSDIDNCWDYDLVLRLSEITNFILLPEVLYFWRRHKNQMTNLNNIHCVRNCMDICRIEAKKRRGLIF